MNSSGGLGGAGPRALFTGPREDPLRYRVDDLDAGRGGGQGIVYPAFDRKGLTVALKLLSGRDIDFERVLAFVPALARLRHPNVVRQVDAFVGTALCARDAPRGPDAHPFDVLYTVCEWIEGVDLTEAVENASLSERLGWVADVARGVATLHAERSVPGGIIHRDVKPSNVRVTTAGRAVLVDYGCARQVEGAPMTEDVGTPGWRAPETVYDRQRVGPAADAWGVAAIAYWSLTSEAPQLVSRPVHQETLEISARKAGARDPKRLAAMVSALLATEQDTRPKNLVRWAEELVATERAGGRRVKVATAAAVAAMALGGFAVDRFGVPKWSAQDHPAASAGAPPSNTTTSAAIVDEGERSPEGSGADASPGLTARVPTGDPDGKAPVTVPVVGGAVGPPLTATPSETSDVPATTAVIPPPTSPSTTAVPSTTWSETTGGETHTWTNYVNAGGQAGPVIPGGTTVQVSCRVQGFRVEDGNTWWYRIASSPWHNAFYASADAFYNNGATSGSLIGTPFVDPAVADC